jgi:hypothetical protein
LGAAIQTVQEPAPAPQLRHRAIVFGLIAIWLAMSQYDSLSPHDVPSLRASSAVLDLILFAVACLFFGRATDYISALVLWTVLPVLHAATLLTMAVTSWRPLLIPAQVFAENLWVFREICLVRFLITFFKPREFFLAYGIAEMFRTFGMGQALNSADYAAPFTWQALLVGHAFSRLMWLGPWLLWTWGQRVSASRVSATGGPDWRKFLGSKALWLCLLAVSGLLYFRLILAQWERSAHQSGPLTSEILSPNAQFFAAIVALPACVWLKRSLGWLSLDRAVRSVLIAGALIGAAGMLGFRYWIAAGPASYVLGLLALALFYSVQTGLLLISAGRSYAGLAMGMSLFLPTLVFQWVPRAGAFGESPKAWETAAACASLVLAGCLLALGAKNLSRA